MTAARVYLSGAIEHAADGGKGWRRGFAAFLRELGHDVYDPAADEKKDLTEEELRQFRRWKREDPARFREVVRKIIAWDLDRIEHRTDYVVALWDEASARGGGTAAELTLAHRLGKPVYLVLGMPAANASGWILATATEVFESFDALKEFLRQEANASRLESRVPNPESHPPKG
jgi:nucleoside 2-deoxyribosyltransferase